MSDEDLAELFDDGEKGRIPILIRRFMNESTGVDCIGLLPDDDLIDEIPLFKIDSLDVCVFISKVESSFNLRVGKEAEAWRTLKDMVNYVVTHQNTRDGNRKEAHAD